MKTLMTRFGLVAGIVLMVGASSAFAATLNLTSGSIGQLAGNTSAFGVAVCNNGSAATTASVPVVVTANGTSATMQSNSSIAAGTCAYTYFPYSSFAMAGGQTYNVTASVNGGSTASYSVTMPGTGGTVLGASTVNTAAVNQSRINLMASEVNLLQQLISLLQSKLGL